MQNPRNRNSPPLDGYASLKDEMDAYLLAVLHVLGYENADLDNLPLSEETIIALCERADWWRRMRAEKGRLAPADATPDRIKAFYSWFENKYQIGPPRSVEGILNHWPDFEVAYAHMAIGVRRRKSLVERYPLYARFEQPGRVPLSPEEVEARYPNPIKHPRFYQEVDNGNV